jgi:hypothetical protein
LCRKAVPLYVDTRLTDSVITRRISKHIVFPGSGASGYT